MSRRDNAALRCPACLLHREVCLCALVPNPPLPVTTQLRLVIHRLEARKPTNTGRLAARCLAGSEVIERGHENAPSAELVAAPGTTLLLLFPHADATALTAADGPATLVVPDGTWSQAAKVRRRVPGLAAARCVTLPPGPPSRYQLRHEAHAHGLATMEAIARAIGILDGAPAQRALEAVFDEFVDRTLRVRGERRVT
jgi:DTW domain-containing protein YfiP